eukprot:8157721-Lingulodinium_polyedra.AAC.1
MAARKTTLSRAQSVHGALILSAFLFRQRSAKRGHHSALCPDSQCPRQRQFANRAGKRWTPRRRAVAAHLL